MNRKSLEGIDLDRFRFDMTFFDERSHRLIPVFYEITTEAKSLFGNVKEALICVGQLQTDSSFYLQKVSYNMPEIAERVKTFHERFESNRLFMSGSLILILDTEEERVLHLWGGSSPSILYIREEHKLSDLASKTKNIARNQEVLDTYFKPRQQ